MRKILIIWNPASGGRSKRIVRRLTSFLQVEAIDFHLADTQKTRDAAKLVRENLDSSYSDLIIIGGDGTVNEAINGLEWDIPVSIVPAGTGDDFVKMIDIGKGLKEHIHTAVYGELSTIDLGVCNGRKFINGVGIGFDGQIVEDMISKRVPLLKGHLAYYYHVLRILGWYKEKHFQFKVDATSYQKDLILLTVGNGSTFGGGFRLMPEAKINDGLLEICEISNISGFRRFLNVGKLSTGSHGRLKEVSFYRGKEVFIAKNPSLFAHIDGERIGSPPFQIKVLPHILKLRQKT